MSKKARKQIKVDNNRSGRFDQQISLLDLPLDDMKAILESIRDSASAEDAASMIDQKLKQSSSAYRNGAYQIVFEEIPNK